jgi:acylphosphatase
MEFTSLNIVISGKVHGVGFRQSLHHKAQALGISGWVQNFPDGTVQARLEGSRQAIETLLGWCNVGPKEARVDRVSVSKNSSTGPNCLGFYVR